MKYFYRIISAMTILWLLLTTGITTHAQTPGYVIPNADSSYNVYQVLEDFNYQVENARELPETAEEFFQNYLYRFKAGDGDFKFRYGDANAEELTREEYEEFGIRCINIIEQKKATISQETTEQPNSTTPKPTTDEPIISLNKVLSMVLLALIVLALAAVFFILYKAKKKNKPFQTFDEPSTFTPSSNSDNHGSSDVIIRRKTTSIMYKQNLDDVIHNNNYMALDGSSFSNDTAIKTMYIKNTCIMDIYNMYADDLRNPNNPKEDGCMVLGRWIHHEDRDEYSVSLEEVIHPGDDAVFAEYELDFGGKIKVKLNDRLRKLRRESNLQYDLTCWVHSHPGLGVFFSNTDCNLHLLHKHPTHPKFLTAIVIDILTPQQELGIFTFKHDMSINSKADLKQHYSLEDWYKWAVESQRAAVNAEEHYNTLERASSRNKQCFNIQLSNSVVIDMDLIVANPGRNPLYFVHGFSSKQSDQTTYTAVKIESADTLSDNELIGCFMAVTHRSYPTIKNMVSKYLNKIRFVLVYSITDETLTTIPVVSNDLCSDESFYGEQPLEELKIWTRRRR